MDQTQGNLSPEELKKRFVENVGGKTYDPMDRIFRLMFGEYPSITNSRPESRTLPQNREQVEIAQKRKYDLYFEQLNLKPGMKVLDIGCGWGSFMMECIKRDIQVEGITPSKAQFDHLIRNGFSAYHTIWQNFEPEPAAYDAIVIMGSAEHFVSIEDYEAGEQNEVYKALWELCAKALKPGGRVGGQTMTFNGDFPEVGRLEIDSKDPRHYHIALVSAFHPESWLPRDFENFYHESNGNEYFRLLKLIDGREDYVWTMGCWGNTFWKLRPFEKWYHVARLLLRALTDAQIRLYIKCYLNGSNKVCMEKGWMSHVFFFLEKQ